MDKSLLTTSLTALRSWKDNGYKKIVLFGRFQPLHKGHMQLLATMRASGLDVHLVLNDKTDNIPGERNPFSPAQKAEMARLALPWLPRENLHTATVYLGRKGVDVGEDVRKLTAIFNGIASPDELVFCYYEKSEDRKEYLVDGEIVENVHYVDLVGQPRGAFPVQRITEAMISEATGDDHIAIDAKMFRKSVKEDDGICYEMLEPAVADYVHEQYELAKANDRLVGDDQSNDTITLDMLRPTMRPRPRFTPPLLPPSLPSPSPLQPA